MSQPQPRLYLIRNSETEIEAGEITHGAQETRLSERGLEMAFAASQLIAQIQPTLSVASGTPSAVDTATLAARGVGMIEPQLRDQLFGVQETEEEAVQRMKDASERLLGFAGTVVAFTHGKVMSLLEAHLLESVERKPFSPLEALILEPGLKLIGRDERFIPQLKTDQRS